MQKTKFDFEKETVDRACIINLVWVFNPEHNNDTKIMNLPIFKFIHVFAGRGRSCQVKRKS